MGGSERKDFATELLDKIRHNINAEEVKEMEADGGIDLNELETILAKGGLKPSTKIIEKFHELDTNKNGKIEESEVESEGSGEDYFIGTLIGAVAGVVFIYGLINDIIDSKEVPTVDLESLNSVFPPN